MDLPSHPLAMTVLMAFDTANFSGNVHGGTILKLLEKVSHHHRRKGSVAKAAPAVQRATKQVIWVRP